MAYFCSLEFYLVYHFKYIGPAVKFVIMAAKRRRSGGSGGLGVPADNDYDTRDEANAELVRSIEDNVVAGLDERPNHTLGTVVDKFAKPTTEPDQKLDARAGAIQATLMPSRLQRAGSTRPTFLHETHHGAAGCHDGAGCPIGPADSQIGYDFKRAVDPTVLRINTPDSQSCHG